MRRGGRALRSLVSIICLYSCLTTTVGVNYGVPVEIKIWDNGRTPLAHMVDVTNGFGLKVLAEHNFLNDNNIAFSPYGLMGIMVALFEGVDGESSFQIQRGMQLPWNRNVMRIGFRDIHRTLKTYFVPEEGFLAGLALNNENVTFNDSYKKILRFYGFDLENDQLPTLPPTNTTSNVTNATTVTGEVTTVSSPMTTEKPESTTAMMREETTNPNAETIDVRAPVDTTTAASSLAPNAESTTMPATATENVEQTTETTTVPTTAQSTVASTTPTNAMPTVTEASMSAETDAETIAQQTSQASSALTEPSNSNEISTTIDMGAITEAQTEPSTATTLNNAAETVTTSVSNTPTDASTTSADMSTTVDMATFTGTTTDDMALSTGTTSDNMATSTGTTNELASTTDITTSADVSTTSGPLETLQRRKKSIVDFIFTNPPYVDDYFFYRSYNVGPELPIPGFDDKMFLANGLKSVQVTYMHYNTVLEHAFLPHLEASALRLPLDSDRYYLLVVLPNRGGVAELGRLLGRMARESDLADVYAALRPRRVRAVVPSFIVKGHVTLTTDLQKLGIRDVFEPRQRDFTPMTRQGGVYVRSIEQAVSVAIRKYRPDDLKKNRYVINRDPVTFSATYPFLYFVMDATIHVALMAGKMVDPLNSRIL